MLAYTVVRRKTTGAMCRAHSTKASKSRIKAPPSSFYNNDDPDILFLQNYMTRNFIDSGDCLKITAYDNSPRSDFKAAHKSTVKRNAAAGESIWREERPATAGGKAARLMESCKVKGGGFAVVGKSSRICSRFSKKNTSFKNANSCMMIHSGLNRPKTGGANRNHIRNSNKMLTSFNDNTLPTNSQFDRSRRSVQQINLITDPSYIHEHATMEEREEGTDYKAAAVAAKGDGGYVPVAFARPRSNYRRPISAAVNVQAEKHRRRTGTINPQRTRTKFLRYLRVLEKSAHEK